MKTQVLNKDIYFSDTLIDAKIKMHIETATDIFRMTIYKKGFFGWRKKLSFWSFSAGAKALLEFLNEWLEVYEEKKHNIKGGKND